LSTPYTLFCFYTFQNIIIETHFSLIA
jgi:hypothetical protein